MAVNIGPRIGIEGEAEYRKQLQNIIQQQKTLKSELKATESAFTKETSAQEKARAKAASLNKQIELQKQRVEAAKRMVDESTKAYGEADSRTQKWKQALADATTELNNMERELSECNPAVKTFGERLGDIGGKFSDIGSKMATFGDALSKKVTVPIAALGAASIKSFSDVDKGMDAVITKTGATGEALDAMKESVETIATTIPTSFENAGNAVGEVNTRFGLTGDALTDLSEQFIKFAQINGTDVVASVDNTQKALSAFGLSAESAGTLLNVLNVVGQNTGVSMDTLLSGLIQNGTAFQEMGLSIDQAVTAMGMMEKSGANSETVMQGLRKALKNAAADGVPLNQALSDLQETIMNGKDGMDGLTAAYELFGKSGDQIYGAVRNGTLDFSALGAAAVDAGNSVSETFENTLDAPDKLNVILNNLKVTGADLANSMFTLLSPAIEKLSEVIKSAADWFSGLDDKQKQTIITVAGVIAAIGPALSIFGRVVTGVGGIVSIVGKLTPVLGIASKAFMAFGAALLANPAGLVIAGIVALVATIVVLWNKCEWFRDAVTTVFSAIVGFLKAKYDSIVNGLNAIGTFFTSTIPGWFNSAKSAVSNFVGTVTGKFAEIKQSITDKINAARDAVKNAIDRIKGFFNFSFKLPKIPLPHFSVAPPGWKIGDLLKGTIPSLSISWYRMAYDNPVVFTKPTVIPTARGLMGFGDGPGAEVVIGMNRLQELVAANAERNSGTFSPNVYVYAQPGQDVNQIADAVMQKMQYAINRRFA